MEKNWLNEPDHLFCLLHRIDRRQNMARFYLVMTGPSLVDEWSVIRFWGRIGGQQRPFVTACVSAEEAQTLAWRLVRRRLQRGYRIVEGNMAVEPVTAPLREDEVCQNISASPQ